MEDNYTDNFHDSVEEEDEVLSLCDLPVDEEAITRSQSQSQSRQSSSSSTESHAQFFEFMSDQSSDMCPAEDVIFCGKVMPLNTPQDVKNSSNGDKKQGRLHRRPGSLSELESYANSTKDYKLIFRNSRSLDDQKLSRFGNKKAVAKTKWYFPMIGIARFPAGMMDMRDIKSRQVRLSTSLAARDTFPANRSSLMDLSSSSSWRFIKALSCNGHASVDVKSSLCVKPHA